MSIRLFLSAVLLATSPIAAFAVTEKVDCTRDTLTLPERDREGLRDLSLGRIVPDIAIRRFGTMECVERALRTYREQGWAIERMTAAAVERLWNDEGWEQIYLISVPLLKRARQPWETQSAIKRFYYTQGWHDERAVEVELGNMGR